MKYYFDGKEKLEIGQFLFNYVNNELVISERNQEIINEFLKDSSNMLFGKKTIKQDNITKIHPYKENDNDKLRIDLNEVDENSNTEKYIVVSLDYSGNDFVLKVINGSTTIIELELKQNDVMCIYKKDNKIIYTKAGENTYFKKEINENKITEVTVTDANISLDHKRSIYNYQIKVNDACVAGKLISITGNKDASGKLYPSYILKRLNLIYETANSSKYEKSLKIRNKKRNVED